MSKNRIVSETWDFFLTNNNLFLDQLTIPIVTWWPPIVCKKLCINITWKYFHLADDKSNQSYLDNEGYISNSGVSHRQKLYVQLQPMIRVCNKYIEYKFAQTILNCFIIPFVRSSCMRMESETSKETKQLTRLLEIVMYVWRRDCGDSKCIKSQILF